ncbi:hypothetical protein GGQ79_002623 [Ochrobactrum pecoris]|uniref:Uncharacterized protein n=1 Tax=Brucella pecoris TaxID=867683 RepID=A0AB34YS43_9HYPH|nr:hypothetical protein [Brucella pecoris]
MQLVQPAVALIDHIGALFFCRLSAKLTNELHMLMGDGHG